MGRTGRVSSRMGWVLLALIPGFVWIYPMEGKAEPRPGLAILPFFVEAKEDPAKGSLCPVCNKALTRGSVLPGAGNALTRLLFQKIEARGTFQGSPAERVEEAMAELGRGRAGEGYVPFALQVGTALKADFVLVGVLFRFEERVGSSLGVEKPASVSLDLHLFRLRDGKMVWSGRFDETQRPLSENMLKIGSFLKRGATWLTAEELASAGMDEMLRKLPSVNELEQEQPTAK